MNINAIHIHFIFIHADLLAQNLLKVLKSHANISILEWIFLAFPHHAVSISLVNLGQFEVDNDICKTHCDQTPECIEKLCEEFSKCCCKYAISFRLEKILHSFFVHPITAENHFAWNEPGIGRSITVMLASGIVYFGILSLNDKRIFQKLFVWIENLRRRSLLKVSFSDVMDTDVMEEKQYVDELVATGEFASSNLILHNLTYFYGTFLAVNRLSVAIEPFECFGLLGVNGAGKTTAFKMLTGDKFISNGNAWVCGASVRSNLSNVYKMIAYCPQFDALMEDFTGRETLEIFGLIHGIRPTEIVTVSQEMATKFDFIQHIDKKVCEYSGGIKRKLNTAIAFLGNPSVVYLDEPTAGLDPGAKRKIWNAISEERSSGKTIVLTTHSMDECEALCSRIAIMVSGEFRCLGSMQQLKNKFSEGYELLIKVKKIDQQM